MITKSKLNKNYWLRKLYVSKLFQSFFLNKKRLRKKVFTSIYKSNHWVQNGGLLPKEFISISGHGSNINTEQFYNLVSNFTKALDFYKINSILDMPCGDFLWINEIIKKKKINYLGIDIVDELINSNKKKYQSHDIKFLSHDIVNFFTKDKFDLVLIRDLFLHINNSDIVKIIENIKKMDVKYIALNSYNIEKNKDVTIGQHRKVNLLIKPFNLNKPIYSFKDYENDKFIYIYDKKSLF